jgi:NADH dehydrogenase (ubiquinone) 1 alpha/beta subcomplex 1
MAIEEEFSIEIPDKDADSIHSGIFHFFHIQKPLLTPSPVNQAVEYILNQPDAN